MQSYTSISRRTRGCAVTDPGRRADAFSCAVGGGGGGCFVLNSTGRAHTSVYHSGGAGGGGAQASPLIILIRHPPPPLPSSSWQLLWSGGPRKCLFRAFFFPSPLMTGVPQPQTEGPTSPSSPATAAFVTTRLTCHPPPSTACALRCSRSPRHHRPLRPGRSVARTPLQRDTTNPFVCEPAHPHVPLGTGTAFAVSPGMRGAVYRESPALRMYARTLTLTCTVQQGPCIPPPFPQTHSNTLARPP